LAWAPFPDADPALLVEDEVEIPVQVGGKVRTVLTVPAGISPDELEALAISDAKVVEAIGAKAVRRVVVVPGRLVNIVV
jgi:leucyl-tRNA synthetase